MTTTNAVRTNTAEQQQPPRRRRSRKEIDVHALRTKLLATCDRYLSEVPLGELNGSMLKSIAEIASGNVARDFEEGERKGQQQQRLSFAMPFPEPGEVGFAELPPEDPPEKGMPRMTAGLPQVPVPSVKPGANCGGIRQGPVRLPFTADDINDCSGLQRRSE